MYSHWLGQFDKPIVFALDREKEIIAIPSTPQQSLIVFRVCDYQAYPWLTLVSI